MTESQLNGFPSDEIADQIQEHPYRFLVCANKFQTGYDEPLLHTMYVDKVLAGVQAVQTLSRLNRSHPDKNSAFVLDFQNNAESIVEAFSNYYRTTLLSDAQVAFKGNAKAFVRTCDFLSAILPYKNAESEKLSIFLSMLKSIRHHLEAVGEKVNRNSLDLARFLKRSRRVSLMRS